MLCLLSALSLCLWCVACKYGSVSRFKGVFSAFYGVCVGLCCSGTLRGLCGFCVREGLGGLKACGVFAPVFIFFAFLFVLFVLLLSFCPCVSVSALLCLSSCLVFVGVLVLLFPYRIKRKKSAFVLRSSLLGFGVFILNCLRR